MTPDPAPHRAASVGPGRGGDPAGAASGPDAAAPAPEAEPARRPGGAGPPDRVVAAGLDPVGPFWLLDEWSVPNAAGAVVTPSGVLASAGDPGQRFAFASITKLCTALAVHIACEEGVTALDAPCGPPGSTVRHLLAHASGLGPEDAARPLTRPGSRRIYSNAGYEVLAGHLEQRSGVSFATYLRESVLEPAGMRTAVLEGSGASGLSGTIDDLVSLARQLLEPVCVAPETLAAFSGVAFGELSGVLPGFGRQEPCPWGLGPEVRGNKAPHWTGARNSPSTFGHFGMAGGFVWVDPVARVACAVLSDRPFGQWAAAAWPRLSDEVLSGVASPPPGGPGGSLPPR